jgi:hypothetical protein
MKTEIEMFVIICSQCSIPFAITNKFDDSLRKSHNTFYCPSGHAQHYPQKTTEEALREKLREKDAEIARCQTRELDRQSKIKAAQQKRKQTLKAKKAK